MEFSWKKKTCLFTSLLHFLVYRLFARLRRKKKEKEIAVKIIFITDLVRNFALICECCS